MAKVLGGPKTFGFEDLASDPTLAPLSDPNTLLSLLDDVDEDQPVSETRPGVTIPGTGDEKLSLSEDDRKTLARELCEVLDRYDSAMSERWKRESEIEDAYELILNTIRSGNYQGASLLSSEMLMAAVDQSHARLAGTILSVEPMMKVEAIPTSKTSPDVAISRAKSCEQFLEDYGRREMKLDQLLPKWLLRTAKVGTAVVLLEWREKDEPYFFYKDRELKKERKKKSFLQTKLIRNPDTVLWPHWVQDWQDAEIMGHREVMTVSEWRRFAAERGLSKDIAQKVEDYAKGDTVPDDKVKQGQRSNIDLNSVAASQNLVRFTNLWCYRALPGDYEPIKFQIILHEGLRETLWIDYNALNTQKHPYYPIRYKCVDGSGWGVGVGQEMFYCQMADEAFRNIEMDNILSSCFPVTLTKAGSMADGQIDRAFPGQKISTDDPEGDFKTVSLADQGPIDMIYQAVSANETRKMTATGLAAVLAGQGDPTQKSGAGTGSTMALIEQAGKKFGMLDTYVRNDLSPLYEGIHEFVAQYASEGVLMNFASKEDAHNLNYLLYTPPQGDLSEMFRISVRAPSAANNREMQKQGAMVAYNFALQHANALIAQGVPILQQTNPAEAERWAQEVLGFTIYLGNIVLELSDVPDIGTGFPQMPEATPQDQEIAQLQQELQQAQTQLQTLQQQMQAMMQPQMAPTGGQPSGTPLPGAAPASPSDAASGLSPVGGPQGAM